jgi:chorismate dehydratase
MAPASADRVRQPLRIGAVGYLNARPLTWALDRDPSRWRVRYDVPSVCATLLHAGEIDLGLVPSVEYLRSDYRMIPGVGVGSHGAIASVALYTTRPVTDVRSIALDTSSRTSVALIQVLCQHHFRIRPQFVTHGPELENMVRAADAALLIGDPAFDAEHEALGLQKVDLGEEWTRMTGLPFIYAAWTGRPGVADPSDVVALQDAQAEGVRASEAIAAEYGRGDARRTARAAAYLRDNVKYGIGPDEAKGLQLFLDHAADLGLGPARRRLEFF